MGNFYPITLLMSRVYVKRSFLKYIVVKNDFNAYNLMQTR